MSVCLVLLKIAEETVKPLKQVSDSVTSIEFNYMKAI